MTVSIRTRQFVRAVRLLEIGPISAEAALLHASAPPSTPAEFEREAAFVAWLTYRDANLPGEAAKARAVIEGAGELEQADEAAAILAEHERRRAGALH